MERAGIVYDERHLEHITGEAAMEYPPDRGLAHQMAHPEAKT